MLAPLVLGTLALCASCVSAQGGPASTVGSGISVQASSSGSASSSSKAAATTTTTPFFRALTATTLSASASGVSITSKAEAPNYSDSRWPYQSFYSGYGPGASTVEVQPIVTDPLGNYTWSLNDSSPDTVPTTNTYDGAYLPPSINSSLDNSSAYILQWNTNISQFSTPASQAIVANATQQIIALINGSATDAASECNTCKQALQIAQTTAQQVPYEIPNMLVNLCNIYSFSKSPACSILFAPNVEGAPATQILYYANLSSPDANWLCNSQFKVCSKPSVTPYYPTINDLVTKAKPANATAPTRAANSTRLKVPHLSDIHLDTRYAMEKSVNSGLKTTVSNASLPAPRFGSFACDTPYDLFLSAMQAVPDLLGEDPAFSIYTGDLVTHEPVGFTEVTTKYAALEETVVYQTMKNYMSGANKSAPIYATISNHDNRYGSGWNAPQWLMPPYLQDLYLQNYDELAGLWQYEGWLSSAEAQQSMSHFTSYSAKTPYGLRIIGLNGNAWYPANIYNLMNTSNADQYGLMAFTAQELQKAEDNGERVWMIMHQPLGYSGTDNLPNPTDLMTQIINRYSPHVIAGVFNGHTHEDQFSIYFDNNSTTMNANTAQMVSWAGPSITPGQNMNSGFKVYEVDSSTFELMDIRSYYTNVTANSQLGVGGAPTWQFLYSAREAYGSNISWPTDAPLNATWHYLVTQQMESNPSLVEAYQIYDTKASAFTKNCTSSVCQNAKICYMRSSSYPLAGRCTPGFGSAQS